MSRCDLCATDPADGLARVSGFTFCARCRSTDPTEALAAAGIPAEWDTRLLRFAAGLGLPGQDPSFHLSCVPERWSHRVAKVVLTEVEVGDPVFDDRVFVRTSDPDRARRLLGSHGVQSALLALLSDVRTNDLGGNHVTLDGPTLTVGVRPIGGLPDEQVVALQLETAALALHWAGRGLGADDPPRRGDAIEKGS